MKKIYRVLHKMRRIYWRVFGPVTVGVRAVIINDRDEFLLVRHSYLDGWYLPGGRVDRKENLVDCLWRELREELNASDGHIEKLLGVYTNNFEGMTDHIAVFVVRDLKIGAVDKKEILEARFFVLDALPNNLAPGSHKRLLEYGGQKEIDFIW